MSDAPHETRSGGVPTRALTPADARTWRDGLRADHPDRRALDLFIAQPETTVLLRIGPLLLAISTLDDPRQGKSH